MKKPNKLTKSKPSEISLDALTTRINEREKQIDLTCVTAVRHAMNAIQLAIDQGNDLLTARALVANASRGAHAKKEDVGWTKWIANNYTKGYETARLYMGLSSRVKTHRDGILQNAKSLREAFRLLGLLPEPDPEPKQLPSINVSPIVSKLNFVAEWAVRNSEEITTWETFRRQELKIQLKPVVELFEKL